MQNTFYLGIVENRFDPLKLGRVQVRVFGVHSEKLQEVPTDSLPWAVVLMPATSASISGIGYSAVAYVEGTLVYVYFQDGESKQQPVVIGSAHGVPLAKTPYLGNVVSENINELPVIQNTLKQATTTVQASSSTTLLDSSGNAILDGSGNAITAGSPDYKQKLKDALGKRESSNNYKAVNQLGYIGKYQMGAPMLIDLGYVKAGSKNSDLNNPTVWTGKGGVTSKEAFLNSPVQQEAAMDAELVMNEKRLRKIGVIDDTSTEQEISGFLATSHLLGTGGAKKMKNGIVSSDANGVTGNSYYNLGYASVDGKEPVVAPSKTAVTNPSREPSVSSSGLVINTGLGVSSNGSKSVSELGFYDKSGQYPKYIKEQDTNRLARNQNINETIVASKEDTIDQSVHIANSSSYWSQSPVPYNAIYPFNHVHETESGHVMEFDDTPNNERIHIYHNSGTFSEIDRNGTKVNKIVGDNFEILERNGYVHIKGNVNITVEGNANIAVGNNCELEVNGNLNGNITGNANWSVGGDWNVRAQGHYHVSSIGDFAVDSSVVNLNSGVSSAGGLPVPTRPANGTISFPELTLEPRAFESLSEFETEDADPDAVAAHKATMEANGVIGVEADSSIVEKTETVEPKKIDGKPVECGMFVSGNINVNDFISTNFQLKDFTKGMNIPLSQAGLKDTELACNLKNLATNVIEPIFAKYPDMIITSGLRPMGANTSSQHPLGMAADLQFRNHKSGDYVEIAKSISQLVPFDQVILEYRTEKRINGVPTTWIHVSYSSKGNRNMLFTMNNDKRIGDFNELKVIT